MQSYLFITGNTNLEIAPLKIYETMLLSHNLTITRSFFAYCQLYEQCVIMVIKKTPMNAWEKWKERLLITSPWPPKTWFCCGWWVIKKNWNECLGKMKQTTAHNFSLASINLVRLWLIAISAKSTPFPVLSSPAPRARMALQQRAMPGIISSTLHCDSFCFIEKKNLHFSYIYSYDEYNKLYSSFRPPSKIHDDQLSHQWFILFYWKKYI